jgi:hypothetical protein
MDRLLTRRSRLVSWVGPLFVAGSLLPAVASTAIVVLCIYYITTGHSTLQKWFLSLNPCFYRAHDWANYMFTPEVKSRGDSIAVLGIILGSLVAVYFFFLSWKLRRQEAPTGYCWPEHSWWYLAVIAGAVLSALWSHASLSVSYDEAFSAVNCAQLHPLQTISYYMLPNNHMYFNLLNNVLFSWWTSDQVATGKALSMLAYVGTSLCVFRLLLRLGWAPLLAFLGLLPVALQFTAWGMATQGRAYASILFFAWLGFYCIARYIYNSKLKYLKMIAICSVAGFAFVPSYLSIYVSQILLLGGYLAYARRKPWSFIQYQLLTLVGVFLCYVPSLLFSGVDALVHNNYVRPAAATTASFLPSFLVVHQCFIDTCFSLPEGVYSASWLLLLVPLTLIFSVSKPAKFVAFAYSVVWLVHIGITLYTRLNPFNRGMIVQYSATMFSLGYAVFFWCGQLSRFFGSVGFRRAVHVGFFAIILGSYAAYLAYFNVCHIAFFLYYNDINLINSTHLEAMKRIPRHKSVACGQESFYFAYLLSTHGYEVSKCPSGKEEYYIGTMDAPLSDTNYRKVFVALDKFEFYQHK